MQGYITEQQKRLVDYAKDTIKQIGNRIKIYNSKNGLDRTGNLLNSLCWGVSHDNRLLDYGFYREATTRVARLPDGRESSTSYLHEFYNSQIYTMYPVDGRQLAEDYIQKFGTSSKGWKIFFAILAPYWGYWEKGFTFKPKFGNKTKFLQFAVMTSFYDKLKKDIKPVKRYYFNVSVAPSVSQSAFRKAYE